MIHRFMIPFPQPAFLSGRVGLDPRPERLDSGRRSAAVNVSNLGAATIGIATKTFAANRGVRRDRS
jgi:hypothetical protein